MLTKTVIISFSVVLGALLDDYVDALVSDAAQFMSILFAFTLDAAVATYKHVKNGNFKTSKSLVFAVKIVLVWALLAVLISIERSNSNVDWLSSAVILPILVSQIFSALKHAVESGLLPYEILKKITSNIDSHKNKS